MCHLSQKPDRYRHLVGIILKALRKKEIMLLTFSYRIFRPFIVRSDQLIHDPLIKKKKLF